MAGKNKKKVTYRQLMNYVLKLEHTVNTALNTLGRTISYYIEFTGQQKEFMEWLKNNKGGSSEQREKRSTKKDNSKK